jgi:hypothetical protein
MLAQVTGVRTSVDICHALSTGPAHLGNAVYVKQEPLNKVSFQQITT